MICISIDIRPSQCPYVLYSLHLCSETIVVMVKTLISAMATLVSGGLDSIPV